MPSVAIIGASNDPTKYGHAAVLAFLEAGWDVYPVNPKENVIAGLSVSASISAVPRPLDWVSIYLSPKRGMLLLPELAEVQAKVIWLNPGTSDPALLEAARALDLPVVVGCSIRAIGKDPADFF